MKLRGSIASPYVARVVMFARTRGMDLKPEPAGDLEAAIDRGCNPFGEIPVLEIGGQPLADTEAICEYLDGTFSEHTLRSMAAAERVHSRLITRALDAHVLSRLEPLWRNLHPPARDASEAAASLGALQDGLTELERCMGRGPYAVAQSLTLADCALLPAMALLNLLFIPAFRLKSPVETLPKLREWWAQMGEDPLCVQVLQEWTMAYQELMRAWPGARSE